LLDNERSRWVSDEIIPEIKRLPAAMFVAHTGRLTDFQNGGSPDEFWARLPNPVTGTLPRLTKEEHDACIAALPDDIARFALPYQEGTGLYMLGGLPVVPAHELLAKPTKTNFPPQ
jgi:diadenosine tetraphosphatase ApaH/serine/threonine PP2A family protein phosphatase